MTPNEIGARLSRLGHRATGPRSAVLLAVGTFERPFTVEELAAALPEVGRATVFRTMKLLLAAGLACRMVLEDGSVRYALSAGGHHHHLICSSCGSVEEFADPALDALIEANAEGTAFTLDAHSLELYGRCRRCIA